MLTIAFAAALASPAVAQSQWREGPLPPDVQDIKAAGLMPYGKPILPGNWCTAVSRGSPRAADWISKHGAGRSRRGNAGRRSYACGHRKARLRSLLAVAWLRNSPLTRFAWPLRTPTEPANALSTLSASSMTWGSNEEAPCSPLRPIGRVRRRGSRSSSERLVWLSGACSASSPPYAGRTKARADRFDGERSKLGELQVEFVSRLANSLGVELVRLKRCGRCGNGPIIPMRPTLRCAPGREFNSSGDSKSISSDIIDLSERALALDPQNERAMVDLAFAFNDRVTNRWDDDPAGDIARADKLADSALALQPDDARAHLAKAEVFFNKQQWRAAISQAEAALADDPNYADAHANLSFWNLFLGHSEDAFAGIETALRLSPRDPDVSLWQFFTCHLHTHLAQWEQAIEWCGKSIASGSQIPYLFVDLAAANAWAGHDKEAKEAAAQLQKVYPGFTVQTWAGMHWSDDPTFNVQYQRIVEGLRKAGVPEGEKKTN